MNRAYQQDAIDCCVSSQQNTNVVKMFCGSGKTRVMIKTFIKMKSNYGCFVFPSIALITQFNNDYGSKYFENFCPKLKNIKKNTRYWTHYTRTHV